MHQLIHRLQKDFPGLVFTSGEVFCWSPADGRVTYVAGVSDSEQPTQRWSLLHETAHGILEHGNYQSDIELLQLETAAWETATQLAEQYGEAIDENHIQDCLDTYRDWLHQRSTCPTCGNKSLQSDPEHYQCFNCDARWKVSASRFCRPYRKKQNLQS